MFGFATREGRFAQAHESVPDGIERSFGQVQIRCTRPVEFALQNKVVQPYQVVFGLPGKANPVTHFFGAFTFALAAASRLESFSSTMPASTYSPVRLALFSDIKPRATNSA